MDEKIYVVFYGDWGGQVYACVPKVMFREGITLKDLQDIALRIEQVEWSCNIQEHDPEGGAMVTFRKMRPGQGIIGGMGGGLASKDGGAWINEEISSLSRKFIEEQYA